MISTVQNPLELSVFICQVPCSIRKPRSSRDTELLAPDKLVEEVDALVLSGGSAFGLDAASGVMKALRDEGRGFAVGPAQVPIVPAAVIFDLINGGKHDWKNNPYPELGAEAYAARGAEFDLGTVGAGTGATTANTKGGLGSASIVLPSGVVVGALVVVNPHGNVTVPGTQHFWAAPFEMQNEFGGLGVASEYKSMSLPVNKKFTAYEAMYGKGTAAGNSPQGLNTTIAIVATNASLDKAQLKRMAVAAHDGMARAIVPSHTPMDGDLVFAVSTNEIGQQRSTTNHADSAMLLGHGAAVCLSRAIARGVFHATSNTGDTLPSWKSLQFS